MIVLRQIRKLDFDEMAMMMSALEYDFYFTEYDFCPV
jgi:hypothetical protein